MTIYIFYKTNIDKGKSSAEILEILNLESGKIISTKNFSTMDSAYDLRNVNRQDLRNIPNVPIISITRDNKKKVIDKIDKNTLEISKSSLELKSTPESFLVSNDEIIVFTDPIDGIIYEYFFDFDLNLKKIVDINTSNENSNFHNGIFKNSKFYLLGTEITSNITKDYLIIYDIEGNQLEKIYLRDEKAGMWKVDFTVIE